MSWRGDPLERFHRSAGSFREGASELARADASLRAARTRSCAIMREELGEMRAHANELKRKGGHALPGWIGGIHADDARSTAARLLGSARADFRRLCR